VHGLALTGDDGEIAGQLTVVDVAVEVLVQPRQAVRIEPVLRGSAVIAALRF